MNSFSLEVVCNGDNLFPDAIGSVFNTIAVNSFLLGLSPLHLRTVSTAGVTL